MYEITDDPKYQEAAELSAAFIQNHLYNGLIIIDSISLATCSTQTDIITYNSGFTIDGLSVLATKNSSWTPL